MDAAQHRELDELRRRAYGLGAGIAEDAAASARLDSLELLLLDEHAREHGIDPDELLDSRDDHAPAAAHHLGPKTRLLVMVVVWSAAAALAVSAAVLALAPRDQRSPVTPQSVGPSHPAALDYTPQGETLMQIPTTGVVGSLRGLPSSIPAPPFATAGEVLWTAPLGSRFGWNLWVGAGVEDGAALSCIAIERDGDVRSRCGNDDARRYGSLRLSLSRADVDPELRPPQMGAVDSIRFWWLDESAVRVVLGRFDGR